MPDDLSGLSRRKFLTIVGATAGAAACSPPHGGEKIIPLLNPPIAGTPGKPTFYASLCRECPSGCGLTVRTREGRVVKLEGNAEHPLNRGALCARGQAALQGLYSTRRLRQPTRRDSSGLTRPVAWDAAIAEIAHAVGANPSKVALVSGLEPGSLGALETAFAESMGGDRLVYEPFDLSPLRQASSLAYGLDEIPAYRLDRARVIVSLGADFLEGWLSPVEHARMLSEARSSQDGRAELVYVGAHVGLTAANADRFLRIRAGTEGLIALALCRDLLARGPKVAVPGQLRASLADALRPFDAGAVGDRTGLSAESIGRLARQLHDAPSSVVLPPGPLAGGAEPTQAAVAVLLLNHLLGNVGETVEYGRDPARDRPSALAEFTELTERMASGQLGVLFLVGVDPSRTLPEKLGFEAALRKVPMSVYLGDEECPASEAATFALPKNHFLEDFSDSEVRSGVLSLGQPAMTPLYDSRPAGDVLLAIAKKSNVPAASFPFASFEDYWRDRAADWAMLEAGKSGDLVAAVRTGQQHGGIFVERPAAAPSLGDGFLQALVGAQPEAPVDPGLTVLVLASDVRRFDGRSADRSWMQEIGDPLTTAAWSSPLTVPTELAGKLGVSTGDRATVTVAGKTAEFPVVVSPLTVGGTVALPAGEPEVLRLIPAASDPLTGARVYPATPVEIRRVGLRALLPIYAGSDRQLGRELARTVAAADRGFRETTEKSFYPEHPHPEHRWAMAIDLDRCTGCAACVAACYAENNLPVVGAEQAAMHRQMAWMRVERFFPESGELTSGVSFLPMLCQQCCDAPCESVCPVEATYHTDEGLNAQVYNRCVGTRYCANNCPYKVRVFNYSDHPWPEPVNLELNPDVTAREKGVMEKCTFCVQRIRLGEIVAREEGRPVRDGEIQPACAQTCPSQAIVFGDIRDVKSKVRAASGQRRAYRVLEDLGTEPAVSYLARIREEEA